ncbi:MAG TPA: BON domain-containing protein [Gammaproteobacteria bacterium]|nr:BON domain-containing protein [Gammaproteobacteria bacterium]
MKVRFTAGMAMLGTLLLSAGCASTSGPYHYVQDAMTTMHVNAQLAGANLPANRIDVRTFDRVVKLSGFVPSQAVRQRALATTRAVSGVERVVDHMTVIDHPPTPDLSEGSGQTR